MLGTADRFLLTSFLIMEASMQVYLYEHTDRSHGGDSTPRCVGIFEPENYLGKTVYTNINGVPAEETDIWPVLMGLHQLDLPFLAHITAFKSMLKESELLCQDGPLWIMITTPHLSESAPGSERTEMLGMDFQLVPIWEDGDSRTPARLLPKSIREHASVQTPEFWSDFFKTKLLDIKFHADQEAAKASAYAKLFSAM